MQYSAMNRSNHGAQARGERTRILRGLTFVLFFALLFPYGLWAQRSSTTLSGTVSDTSGAVVPGAALTATETSTGAAYKSVSDSSGFYVISNLAPGEYRLQVEMAGFKTYVQPGILLRVDQAVTVYVKLEVGAQTQKVTVTGTPPQVDTESSTVSTQVTTEMANQLPLNGRVILQLMALAPDTGPSTSPGTSSASYQQSTSNPDAEVFVSASGGRGDSVNFLLDGALNEDSYTSIANAFPNPDAIGEFSFETNNYSAKYGGRGGGVMNAVTKGGTNQIHGTAFEFVRYYSLNARNFFGTTQDGLKRNQYGGTLGGPFQKDKMFAFFSYQGTTLRSLPSSNSAFTPTAAELTGDFSAITKQLKNPFTGVNYTNNFISPTTWDPVAVNFMKLVPVGTAPTGLVYYTSHTFNNDNQFVGRLDRNFGNKLRIYGTYLFDSVNAPNIPIPGDILSAAESIYDRSQNYVVNAAYTFSPTLLSTLAVGVSRRLGIATPPAGMPSWYDLGVHIPDIIAGIGTGKDLYLSGVTGYFSVSYPNAELSTPATTGDVNNNWTWVRSQHTVEFGGEWNKAKYVQNSDSIGGGGFSFAGAYSGNDLTDFLVGDPSSFYQYSVNYVVAIRNLWGLYANDSWKVTRRLTLNLGVRWNPFVPSTASDGQKAANGGPSRGAVWWNPAAYAAGTHSTAFPNLPPGYFLGGFDAGYAVTGQLPSYTIFDPRIGFAYDVFGNGKTSVRGGYGIFQEQIPINGADTTVGTNPPFSYRIADSPPPGTLSNPYGSTTPPFPLPSVPTASEVFPFPFSVSAAYTPGVKPPTIQQWNFTVEQQLPGKMMLRLAYEGSESYHLQGSEDGNPAIYNPSETLAQNLATNQARRPYGAYFSKLSLAKNVGTASFESLTGSVIRQVGSKLTFIGGYRWSKCLDEAEYVWYDSITYSDPNNTKYDKGQCAYDIGSKLTLSYVYQLPTLSSLGFAGKYILGGWQTGGILTWQDGLPFGIAVSTNQDANGLSSYDRGQIIGNPHDLGGGRSEAQKLAEWFDTSAFTLAAPGAYGDTARDYLRGPGLSNLDFSLIKSIPIRWGPAKETQHLDFRAEAFNLFNHPNFANPGSTYASTSFGKILTANSPRIMQLALKFVF